MVMMTELWHTWSGDMNYPERDGGTAHPKHLEECLDKSCSY
jgi:hypothetical protein